MIKLITFLNLFTGIPLFFKPNQFVTQTDALLSVDRWIFHSPENEHYQFYGGQSEQ